MKLPAHEVTTRHLGAAYPFMSEPGLGRTGVLIGRDLVGGSFFYDPFELYRNGLVTNPNMVVFGQIGRGKSSFVKTYLWRQAVFGRRAWVIDPKGEYAPLARAWGTEPLSLRPGGSLRLNPLETPGGRGSHEDVTRRRAELLSSLAAASLARAVRPAERAAIEVAVADVSANRDVACETTQSASAAGRSQRPPPTLPSVVDALMSPTPESARTLRTDVRGLAADGREVALELRRLVSGDLRGMFDGETSEGVNLGGSLVVLDLSAVYHSSALGVLMTCAAAWLQAGLGLDASAGFDGHGANAKILLVVDEAWAILSNLWVARWLQSAWKLSRSWGVSNLAVLHRISDLDSAGADSSEQRALALGLLADSETRVVYGQPHGEVERAVSVLGLSETEADLVPKLGRGVALWKVGSRSFLVQHRLSPYEMQLVDTDARMVERTGRRSVEVAPRPRSQLR